MTETTVTCDGCGKRISGRYLTLSPSWNGSLESITYCVQRPLMERQFHFCRAACLESKLDAIGAA